MRIISGSARGRRLETPRGDVIRPTTDRVREAVFNMLFSRFDIEDLAVADLFAGTGAYGLEALSRGVKHVTFVDQHRESAALVGRNVETLGFDEQATVTVADAVAWARSAKPVDLAFCDPPYAWDEWPRLLDALRATWVVAESGESLEAVLAENTDWSVLRTGVYGATVVTLLQQQPVEESAHAQENAK